MIAAVDLGALNREWVLENDALIGSVNANRRHYDRAAQALADADRDWLAGLVTRQVSLEQHRRVRRQRRRRQNRGEVLKAGRIEDYAVIDDRHTAALLDTPGAGRWRLAPVGAGTCTRRRYREDTLVQVQS